MQFRLHTAFDIFLNLFVVPLRVAGNDGVVAEPAREVVVGRVAGILCK